jgi:flavoprotein
MTLDLDAGRRKLPVMPAHQQRSEILTSPLTVAIEIDRTSMVALRPAAAARGTTVAKLATSILETVVRDALADAVLDDGY